MFTSSFSSDGEKAIVYGLGDLAGTQGSGESVLQGEVYLDSRTDAGWHLSPLNGPSSEYVGQLLVTSEADSGETLWNQHTPAQAFFNRGLYIRSAEGEFSFVGPLTPPLAEEESSNSIDLLTKGLDEPVAATSDYGHVVLFAADLSAYWPFDLTTSFRGSLYEYSGTVSERTGIYKEQPILVGVSGGKGSKQLLGVCGTHLGGAGLGGGSSASNALSDDGETVFFTVLPGCGLPVAAEVYARLHGSLSSPLPAETVHVSASECTAACGGESGKNFEGASKDGSRVFFTSTQKLTNDAADQTVDGDSTEGEGCAGMVATGSGCDLYEYDFSKEDGSRLTLVSGGEVLGVAGIARDGLRAYFVSKSVLGAAGENEFKNSPEAEQPNLYVYDAATEKTTFVGTLSYGDQGDWQRAFERPVQVGGAGGRFLLFASSKLGLTPDDETATSQLFEYDADTGELARLTKGENGYGNNGNNVTAGVLASSVETVRKLADFKSQVNSLSMSGDGRTVFFLTKSQLSSRAVSARQGCRNLYEFHSGGAISQGAVSLVSDGRDTQLNKGTSCGPQLQGVDETGSNVLFTSADPLVPGDVDGVQRDIYDARVGGGFPVSSGDAVGVCGPGLCEGASSSSIPILPTPSSTTQGAEGISPSPPAVSVSANTKKGTVTSRAQKLAAALKACKKKPKGAMRVSCERQARKHDGPIKQKKK